MIITVKTTINTINLRAIEEQIATSNLENPEMMMTRQSGKTKYKDGQNVKYA